MQGVHQRLAVPNRSIIKGLVYAPYGSLWYAPRQFLLQEELKDEMSLPQ